MTLPVSEHDFVQIFRQENNLAKGLEGIQETFVNQFFVPFPISTSPLLGELKQHSDNLGRWSFKELYFRKFHLRTGQGLEPFAEDMFLAQVVQCYFRSFEVCNGGDEELLKNMKKFLFHAVSKEKKGIIDKIIYVFFVWIRDLFIKRQVKNFCETVFPLLNQNRMMFIVLDKKEA